MESTHLDSFMHIHLIIQDEMETGPVKLHLLKQKKN
tara:strand:- start:652 stop:759 length:108 start_codon:yes stop_codon:yes gene_type:complete